MNDKTTTYPLTAYVGVRELIAEKGINCTFKFAKENNYKGIELLYIDNECNNLLSLSIAA